ncbi:unnamed protein product [Larinioides sclopetarius]|uniref:Uncharacterized protein n=1 Tax=Larinioides sclopetarius TaxID=280406 RepID=A0AAV2B6L0_9ARAC
MDEGRKEYKFLWFVENYSCNTAINNEAINSPKFSFDGMEGITFDLYLYPKGFRQEGKGNVSLFLRRCEADDGPKDVLVKFELSFLALDGSALQSRNFEIKLSRNHMHGSYQFVQRDEIHLRRKTEYLSKDTLRVCCKIWKGEGDVRIIEQISARTQILLEKISFLHTVEDFSTLKPDVKNKFEISSNSKENGVITSNLYFTSCSCEEMMIEILLPDAKKLLRKCKLFLLDRSGNLTDCGGVDYGYNVTRMNVHKLPLTLRREVILNNKSEYLPDDKLLLICEFIFSLGLIVQRIEEIIHELPLTAFKKKNNIFYIKDIYNSTDIVSEYSSALEDMKTIYINQRFSDVELKTKTKSFKAHKNVLCARSPVFEAMLSNDMKEKNTNCIQIDDLENDTVHQLLLFLYSDKIENIQWKSATQLYYAADKYQIGKLKAMCSSFMTENLSASNASDLLLLSDTHNDSNLKKVVEDFILNHEDLVFGSEEWEKLIETHPLLVIKTMHLKYKRKNEAN